MATYSFSVSSGFGTIENIALINSDIDAQIEIPRLATDVYGDCVVIQFQSPLLPDHARVMQNIFTARDPPPPPVKTSEAYFEMNSTILRHKLDGVVYNYIGSQSNEIHISKESQGHYSSIKAAILENPGPNNVFIVHPGDYIEDNPISLAVGTVLIACGNAENTYITAQNDATILNLNVKCKVLGFTFRNGSTGIYFNQASGYGRYSAIMESFIVNCMIGIDCDGGNAMIPDTLYAREIVVSSSVRTLDKGILIRQCGQFISAGVTIFGVPPMGPNPAVPITYGYYGINTGSKLAMSVSNCYFCGTGMYLDDNCSSELTLLTLKYNGYGVIIGATGLSTRFSVNSLEIFESVVKDITVLSTNSLIEVHSGVFDDTKIYNPNAVRLNMRYHTNKYGKTRQRMLGIINVGTPNEPAKMIIGEGNYDVYSLVVLQNTDGETGTWSDITADALEDSGNPFNIFANVFVGNCLYIGRDKVPIGIKLSVLTATLNPTNLADLVWEYWNGTSWVTFGIMQTQTNEPFDYVANSCISAVGSYHIRFGLTSASGLVNKTLNGATKKWVRTRVVNELSSVPTSEYILAHTHSTKIGSDGFREYFGDARNIKKLPCDLSDCKTDGSSQIVYYSKKLYTEGVSLVAGNSLSFNTFIPMDLDCSFPIKARLSVLSATSITLTTTFRYANATPQLYLTEADAPADVGDTVITALTAGEEHIIETMIPCKSLSQKMWFSVEVDSNVIVIQLAYYYMSWSDGSHVLSY